MPANNAGNLAGGAVPQGTCWELHLGSYDLLGLCSRCSEQLEWWQSKDCCSTWDSLIWKSTHMNWLAIWLASIHYVFIITPSRIQWLLLNSGCPASTVIFGITGSHLYLLVLWAFQWYRLADHYVVWFGVKDWCWCIINTIDRYYHLWDPSATTNARCMQSISECCIDSSESKVEPGVLVCSTDGQARNEVGAFDRY
jgi:hypothetical protein